MFKTGNRAELLSSIQQILSQHGHRSTGRSGFG